MSEPSLGIRHQRVQRLRRLLSRRSVRRTERAFVAEGAKVISEALASQAAVEALFFGPEAEQSPAERAVLDLAAASGVRCFRLGEGVLERVADTVTPQGILGIVSVVDVDLAALSPGNLVLVLEDVRDPGNVGAIIRSADAAGADGVILLSGTADLYNPKVVRASAGSIFHLPIVTEADPAAVVEQLHLAGVTVLATVMSGGIDYALDEWPGQSALVFGNEANGVSAALIAACDATISIPIEGAAESLNVAMAATVLAFESARRRRVRDGRSR